MNLCLMCYVRRNHKNTHILWKYEMLRNELRFLKHVFRRFIGIFFFLRINDDIPHMEIARKKRLRETFWPHEM